MWFRMGLSAIFALLTLCVVGFGDTAPESSWVKKAPMPHPYRFLFQNPVGIGNRMYAVTGRTVWSYDPARDKWESRDAALDPYRYHFAVASLDGKLYAFGGMHDGKIEDSVEVYDPAKGVWEKRAKLPIARRDAKAVVAGGLIYVVGGFDATGEPLSILVYDPARDTWEKKKTTSKAGNCWGAQLVGKRIFIFGTQEEKPNSEVLEVYDPAKDKLEFGKPVPDPRKGYTTAVSGKKIYVVGGHLRTLQESLRSVDVYDTAKKKWSKLSDLPLSISWMGAAVFENRLYVMGGVHDDWGKPETAVIQIELER